VFCSGDILLKVNARGGLEHALSSIEASVLRCVRISLHSVKLREISQVLGISISEAYEVVERLIAKGFLRQHSRDTVPASHPEARFFTERSKREIIDTLILSERA